MQAKSFDTAKKFFDDRNFPRGFTRSGDFTRSQASILETLGLALKDLHEGHRAPATDEELHFVEVCQSKVPPTTDVERAWQAYLNALARKQIYFTASSAAVSDSDSAMDSDDTDDD